MYCHSDFLLSESTRQYFSPVTPLTSPVEIEGNGHIYYDLWNCTKCNYCSCGALLNLTATYLARFGLRTIQVCKKLVYKFNIHTLIFIYKFLYYYICRMCNKWCKQDICLSVSSSSSRVGAGTLSLSTSSHFQQGSILKIDDILTPEDSLLETWPAS